MTTLLFGARLAVGALLTGLALSGHAKLTAVDSSFGHDSVLVDDATGLKWLTLGFTLGQSYDAVLSETAAGGLYQGFRFADGGEVETMLKGQGVLLTVGNVWSTEPPTTSGTYCPPCVAGAFETARLFTGAPGRTMFGLTERQGRMPFFDSYRGLSIGESSYQYVNDGVLVLSQSDPRIGSFLVSTTVPTSAVPEPATYALMLAGVAGIALRGRRTGKGDPR